MSWSAGTKQNTIPLSIDSIPRRFRGDSVQKVELSEDALIENQENYVLLGAPGSGKTTTIKRLARRILLSEDQESADKWQYPIVIRLRDVTTFKGLDRIIADAIGVQYTFLSKKDETEEEEDNPDANRGDKEREKKREKVAVVKDRLLEDVIAEVADTSGAILLLDGLDEVDLSGRIRIEKQIYSMSLKLAESKIIVSCRSGDFVRSMQGFNTIEISPLTTKQLNSIASRWLENKSHFMEIINKQPFNDLASRPLFLCQLIVFYRNTGYLPEQPAEIYRRIIRLMLEEWDQQRGIHRRSKYSNFGPDRKIDFLAAVAYHLTYKVKTKRFKAKALRDAYLAVCSSFGLPRSEVSNVAGEIESHTGLILESGSEYYEFSHLSLQEFLCAYYLVREPFAEHLITYLMEYPAPVAVAVSLSSNPSNWFAGLFLSRDLLETIDELTVSSLLSRVLQEKPTFSFSVEFGFAILKIMFLNKHGLNSYIVEMLEEPLAKDSLIEALRWHTALRCDTCYQLDKSSGFTPRFNFNVADSGSLSLGAMDTVLQACNLVLTKASWVSPDTPRFVFKHANATTKGNPIQ